MVTGQIADTDAAAHTPGADVAAKTMLANERVITITQRIYHSVFLDKLDDKLSQYDIRGELAIQQAEALSTKIDKEVAALIKTAAGTAGVAGQPTGNAALAITGYTAATTSEAKGDLVVGGLFDANVEMNDNDVPMDGRQFIATPKVYAEIVQSQKAVNRDFTNGNGGIDSGTVLNIAGTPIMWSNHLPDTTGAAATLGLFFQSGCVGVVKAMDITSEANYIPEKLGDLLTSYYAIGMGVLEPAKAIVIVDDAI